MLKWLKKIFGELRLLVSEPVDEDPYDELLDLIEDAVAGSYEEEVEFDPDEAWDEILFTYDQIANLVDLQVQYVLDTGHCASIRFIAQQAGE